MSLLSGPFRDLVISALIDQKNDIDLAHRQVTDALFRNSGLMGTVISTVVRFALNEALRNAACQQRRVVRGDSRGGNVESDFMVPLRPDDEAKAGDGITSDPSSALLRGYAAVAADSLLNYTLNAGRLRLGEATRVDLLRESSWRFKASRTMFVDAKWLRAIAAQLPNDKTKVNDVLTELQVKTLREQAEGKKAEVAA